MYITEADDWHVPILRAHYQSSAFTDFSCRPVARLYHGDTPSTQIPCRPSVWAIKSWVWVAPMNNVSRPT